MHVGFDRVDRPLDDEFYADCGGEVKDDIASIDPLGEQRLVVDRVDDIGETGRALEMREVLDRAGRQIVDDPDFMPAL